MIYMYLTAIEKEEKQPVTRMTAKGMEVAFFSEAVWIQREGNPKTPPSPNPDIGGVKNILFSQNVMSAIVKKKQKKT